MKKQNTKIELKNISDEKVKIKIKKLNPDAIIPKYSHVGDAGMDLFSVEKDFILKPKHRAVVKTGLSIELPKSYVSLVWDKSGVARSGIKTMGGVLDSNYRGEYKIILINLSSENYEIKKGQKIAQLLIQKIETAEIEEVDELSETTRGGGGFGSTGKF
jgi:dUTP pyrophosphatase